MNYRIYRILEIGPHHIFSAACSLCSPAQPSPAQPAVVCAIHEISNVSLAALWYGWLRSMLHIYGHTIGFIATLIYAYIVLVYCFGPFDNIIIAKFHFNPFAHTLAYATAVGLVWLQVPARMKQKKTKTRTPYSEVEMEVETPSDQRIYSISHFVEQLG